ncbi:MAG: hypothetical protein P4L85_13720 [Paludisphaera borealis]|uniref:hypothetical protein n=1 Tax=Paludisphaera borealis TaxID=1387353 RepID=UPI00283F2FA3|nr:hypothetical protein [Paludisphaera borealis]MDR3620404.1 hypothetical protein [Paludisphaera borealis]
MKTTIRVAALLTAVSMVSGCTNGGLMHRDRKAGALKLPTAPTLDPSPTETGTVGTPSPNRGIPMVPSASPFDGS